MTRLITGGASYKSARKKNGRAVSARPLSSIAIYCVTAAVNAVVVPVEGTFRTSSGVRVLVRCVSAVTVPPLPRTV